MESICVTVSIRDLKLRNRITANCSPTELFVFGEDPFNTSLGSLKFNSTVDRELTNFKPFQRKLNQPSPVKRNSAPFNTPGRQSTQQAKVTKLESSPKTNSVQNCLSVGSINPEFGKMPDGRLICPLCSKFFDIMATARRHFETVHKKNEITCEMCGKQFGRKDNLKAHLMKVHGMESDTARFLSDKAAQKS
ncbi:uncharacterized protein LOC142338523 [Convolutriloba macropyga]|uniref:uncharacterized protein LOC142338523 n=1 Tax=Convolutriloba macropyga TaxID=536237 RepID=UPI003F5227F7